MNRFPFLLATLLAAPLGAQTPTPTPLPELDPRLRFSRGQTTTQTVETRIRYQQEPFEGEPDTGVRYDAMQIFGVKSQVLDVTPASVKMRFSFTDFDMREQSIFEGQIERGTQVPFRAILVGASVEITWDAQRRVVEVKGLDDLLARRKKALDAMWLTPQERADADKVLPSRRQLLERLTRQSEEAQTATNTRPKVGQVVPLRSEIVGTLAVMNLPLRLQTRGQKALRAYDGKTALWRETARLTVPTQPLEDADGRTFYRLEGHLSGEQTMNLRAGVLVQSRRSTRLKGKMTFVSPDGERASAPLFIESHTKIHTTGVGRGFDDEPLRSAKNLERS